VDVDVDVNALTVILAARLAAIVPAGFYIEAADGMLWYSAEEGRFPGETDADRSVGVAVQALAERQDYIDEATHDPWPGTSNPPPPHARIHDSKLHVWYGGPDDVVVLGCEPIPLANIGRAG
jgi:hypothetical protein